MLVSTEVIDPDSLEVERDKFISFYLKVSLLSESEDERNLFLALFNYFHSDSCLSVIRIRIYLDVEKS